MHVFHFSRHERAPFFPGTNMPAVTSK